jgi:hypothetical protein
MGPGCLYTILDVCMYQSTLWFIDRFTVTRATPELTCLQVYRETHRTQVDVRLTQAAAWDGSAALAQGKILPLRKLALSSPTFANHP